MTASCAPAWPAYTDRRGVETSDSGTPHPSDLRFFCAPMPEIRPWLGGARNTQYSPPSIAVSNLQAALRRAPLQLRKSIGGHHGQ